MANNQERNNPPQQQPPVNDAASAVDETATIEAEKAAQAATEPVPAGKEAKKVVIDKEVFDQIMANQAEMLKQVKILRESVNQGRLGEAESKLNPKELKRTFLKVWGRDRNETPRVVIGWKSGPQNKIIRNPNTNMPVGEVLQADFFFLGGGSSGLVEQVEFTRTEEVVYARVVKDISPTEWVIQFENPHADVMVDEKGRPITFEPIEFPDADGKMQTYENSIRINKSFCNP